MFAGWTDFFLPTVSLLLFTFYRFFSSSTPPFVSSLLGGTSPPPPMPPDWEAEDQITVGGSLARWQWRGQGGGGMEGDQISRFQLSSVHLPPTPTPGLETEWLSWEGKHAIHLLFPQPSSSSLLHMSSLPLQINKGSKREPSTQRDNSSSDILYLCVSSWI